MIPAGESNPASAFSGTTAKPSLGPTFSYLVDAILWLAKANQVLLTDKGDLYVAEIFKSRKTVFSLCFLCCGQVVLSSMQATDWCFLELVSGAFKGAQPESTM